MALEGGSIGFQLGGQSTDFVLLVMNDRGATSVLSSKVKVGADASAAAGPKGRIRRRGDRCRRCRRRCSATRARAGCSPAFRSKARPSGRTTMPTRSSTAARDRGSRHRQGRRSTCQRRQIDGRSAEPALAEKSVRREMTARGLRPAALLGDTPGLCAPVDRCRRQAVRRHGNGPSRRRRRASSLTVSRRGCRGCDTRTAESGILPSRGRRSRRLRCWNEKCPAASDMRSNCATSMFPSTTHSTHQMPA